VRPEVLHLLDRAMEVKNYGWYISEDESVKVKRLLDDATLREMSQLSMAFPCEFEEWFNGKKEKEVTSFPLDPIAYLMDFYRISREDALEIHELAQRRMPPPTFEMKFAIGIMLDAASEQTDLEHEISDAVDEVVSEWAARQRDDRYTVEVN
jgi:hypothetical protein